MKKILLLTFLAFSSGCSNETDLKPDTTHLIKQIQSKDLIEFVQGFIELHYSFDGSNKWFDGSRHTLAIIDPKNRATEEHYMNTLHNNAIDLKLKRKVELIGDPTIKELGNKNYLVIQLSRFTDYSSNNQIFSVTDNEVEVVVTSASNTYMTNKYFVYSSKYTDKKNKDQ